MAVVPMKKMSIVAHSSEESRLMKIFLKSGAVEISATELVELTSYPDVGERRGEIEGKLSKVSFALNFLKETQVKQKFAHKNNKNKGKEEDALLKVSFKRENQLVPLEQYEEIAKEEFELHSAILEIEKINSLLIDYKSERARNNALIEQITPYQDIAIKFSECKDTENTVLFFGQVSSSRLDIVREELEEKTIFHSFSNEKEGVIYVVAHREIEQEVRTFLSENDFVKCPFTYDSTPYSMLQKLEENNRALEEKSNAILLEAVNYISFVGRFKLLYDSYLIEIAKIDCIAKSPGTKRVFITEGWVPANIVEKISEEIGNRCARTALFFRDPFDDEIPPTLTKNDWFSSQFTGITDSFGKPNYRERDPGLFVALFYFLIFGIMMGDAGYGLIMTIACFTLVKITKPVKDSGKMLLMFGLCGVSTIFWGIAFGSWFGIEPTKTFLRHLTWFNPMSQPLLLFVVSLAVGLLQIGAGFALNGIAKIKAGQLFQGLLNDFSWIVIFIGVFFLGPNIMVFLGAITPNPVPQWFSTLGNIGLYVALVGFALLMLGGAVGKRNPFKMVTGALGNAYNSINVISDLLSYARLFGLGLTTGVIGYAFNMLAGIIVDIFFKGLWIGWVVAAPILVVGHSFNLGINLLGAYVHDSRLQYVEFFGKFYEGTGRAFNPLGSKTKYTYMDN